MKRGPIRNPRIGWGLKPTDAHLWALMEEEAKRAKLPLTALAGLKRKNRLVANIARARVWKRLKEEGYSYVCIGAVTGYHHVTIMDWVRRLPVLELDLLSPAPKPAVARTLALPPLPFSRRRTSSCAGGRPPP